MTFSEEETISTPNQEAIYISEATKDFRLTRWGYVTRDSSWLDFDVTDNHFRAYVTALFPAAHGDIDPNLQWYVLGGQTYSGVMTYLAAPWPAHILQGPEISTRNIKFVLVPWRPPGLLICKPLVLIVGLDRDWRVPVPARYGKLVDAVVLSHDGMNSNLMDNNGRVQETSLLPSVTMCAMQGYVFAYIRSYTDDRYVPFFLEPQEEREPQLAKTFTLWTARGDVRFGGFLSLTRRALETDPLTFTPITVAIGGAVPRQANYLVFGPGSDGRFFSSPEIDQAFLLVRSNVTAMLNEARSGRMVCDDGSYPSVASAQYGGYALFFSKSAGVMLRQLFANAEWAPSFSATPFVGGVHGPDALVVAWNSVLMVDANGSLDRISRAPLGVDLLRTPVGGLSGFEYHTQSLLGSLEHPRVQLAFDGELDAVRIVIAGRGEAFIEAKEYAYFGEIDRPEAPAASAFIPMTIPGYLDGGHLFPLLYSDSTRSYHSIGAEEWTTKRLSVLETQLAPVAIEAPFLPEFFTTFFSVDGENRVQFISLIPRVERKFFLDQEMRLEISYETDEDVVRFVHQYQANNIPYWDRAFWDQAQWDGLQIATMSPSIRLGVFGRFIRVGIRVVAAQSAFFIKGFSLYSVPAGGVRVESNLEGKLANV